MKSFLMYDRNVHHELNQEGLKEQAPHCLPPPGSPQVLNSPAEGRCFHKLFGESGSVLFTVCSVLLFD